MLSEMLVLLLIHTVIKAHLDLLTITYSFSMVNLEKTINENKFLSKAGLGQYNKLCILMRIW